jgi:hypothetical protein
MNGQAPETAQYPSGDYGPQEELFDWAKIRRYVAFSLRSVGRRPWIFLLVASGMVALAAGALAVLPKTYEVGCRLLTQKNPVLAVRADASQADLPTRSAAETIVRRENLHALIRQTRLLQEWPMRRAPVLRAKDWILGKLRAPPSEEQMLDALTGLLEKRLNVWTTPDGGVVIQLQWPDGVMAYRLVDAAQQNFFETRHVLEVSTIAEQISILEGHAADLKKEIDKQVDDLQRRRERSAPKGARLAVRPPPPKPIDPEALNLKVMLDAKRRAIADLEDYRQRHLIELQTRLAEQRAVYSESHPVIVDLQQSIDSLQAESPQLATLHREEADLLHRLAQRTDGAELVGASALAIPADLIRNDPLVGEDSAVEYARAQLRFSVQQYASLRERIDAGRIDLDTARAAFKYRYTVVVPPEVPHGPIKPNAMLVMVAALIAGLGLALFATTAADLRSGVVLELWQLHELLGPGRPVVDVSVPMLPPGNQP